MTTVFIWYSQCQVTRTPEYYSSPFRHWYVFVIKYSWQHDYHVFLFETNPHRFISPSKMDGNGEPEREWVGKMVNALVLERTCALGDVFDLSVGLIVINTFCVCLGVWWREREMERKQASVIEVSTAEACADVTACVTLRHHLTGSHAHVTPPTSLGSCYTQSLTYSHTLTP